MTIDELNPVVGSAAHAPLRDDRKPRPTIKDVAKVAGVHFTTVSLALRDHTSIPLSTKERIRAAAAKLGYEKNPVFAALTHFHINGRVRATAPRIGYLINHSLKSGSTRFRHHDAFLRGAKEQARILGYELQLLSVAKDGHDSASLSRVLAEQNITGVIISSFEPGLPTVELDWGKHAVVKINSLHVSPEALMVANDQRQDVRLAFRRMKELGYKRIGLAVGQADEDGTAHRYTAGYLIEQADIAPADRIPELLFPYGASIARVSELLDKWVRRYRIDGVVCNWSNIDEMLRAAGYSVPNEVGCACLCLLEKNDRLAGICPNLHMVGLKAVSLLTTLLKSGELGIPAYASSTYVRSFWQDGDSATARS